MFKFNAEDFKIALNQKFQVETHWEVDLLDKQLARIIATRNELLNSQNPTDTSEKHD